MRERVLKSSMRETVDFSLRELVCDAIAGIRILEDIVKLQISTDEEDLHDLQVGSDKVRAALLEIARRAGNQPKGTKYAESKREEVCIHAKGQEGGCGCQEEEEDQ